MNRLFDICNRTALALLYTVVIARAQDSTLQKPQELEKFLNMDAKDTATKLELIQQMLYRQEVDSAIRRFEEEYGDRVRLREVSYPSGLPLIPGYVFTARAMDKGKKYPGFVLVHGGFHDHFDTYFFKLIDDAVSRGYVVIFPDYRGSSGYGANHYQNAYGTTDVADVIAAGQFLAKQDYVDPNRMGIVGHSRGGMVTLLAIEKAPRQFKAAVEIAGLTDFVAYMSYKPDYRRAEVAKEASFSGKLPNDNLAAYMDVSPVNHVEKIQTPLLVLANTFDETVPLALHSGRLIELLKAHGKVFDSHIYTSAPGGHMFPFAETDESRDCMRRTFEWLGRYLKP
ncbi:MAG: alpha/beta hydrolase family protein [Bryobacteraceae bacterium]